MARYINADEAVNALKRWFKFPDYNKGEKNIIACAITMLEEAPTADVVERKRGKWIINESYIKCSNCKDMWSNDDIEMIKSFNFCPNCGARMVRGDKDE